MDDIKVREKMWTDGALATYNYCDENGVNLYQVVRFYPKDFKQRRYDLVNDEWIWGLGDTRRVLYNLPALVRASSVVIVEGEKDVETLKEKGFGAKGSAVPTTCCGGSSAWKPDYNIYFLGKIAYVIPDNDNAGEKFADTVIRNIYPFVKNVKKVNLYSQDVQSYGKDVTDWFREGHTAEELVSILVNASSITELFPQEKPKVKTREGDAIDIDNGSLFKARSYNIGNLIDVYPSGKAYCINHHEHIPSMDTRGGYCYCYSCGWHGDVIALYMKLRKVGFQEAVTRLERLVDYERH
jgi:DNA primase